MPLHPCCVQVVALGSGGLAGAALGWSGSADLPFSGLAVVWAPFVWGGFVGVAACAARRWACLISEAVWAAFGWAGLIGAAGCPSAGPGLLKAAAPRVFAELGLMDVAASAAPGGTGLVGAGSAARGWASLIGMAVWMFTGSDSIGAFGLRAPPSVLGVRSVIGSPGPENPGMCARVSRAV
jgi:hypothetical protein